jgi:Skp family chaperone for outer membrane proteins
MIRKIVSTVGFGLLISAASLAQTSTAAATSPTAAGAVGASNVAAPVKIGIINIQGAIVNTNEGLRDFETLQKKFEPKQTELKTQNDEIEGLKKQLAASTDKLSDDERGKRVQSIEGKQKSFQRNYEDFQNDVQQQQNELAQRIGTKLMEVLDKYAKANNLAMVIDVSSQSSPVLWASQAVDITKPVVDAYNAASGVAAPPRPAAATGPAVKPPVGPAAVPKKPAPTVPATSAPVPK